MWYLGDTHTKIAALVHIKPISVGGWARGRGLTMREERNGPAPKWNTTLALKLWTADVAECDVCNTCSVSINTFRSYRRTHNWFVRSRSHGHARRLSDDDITAAKNGKLGWLKDVPTTMIRCAGCLGHYPYTVDAARCPHCGAERAA